MNKPLYFLIEGKELYLDEIFVDFNELPIYFSCVFNNEYYLALCCECENQNYVVVESSAQEILEMLAGKIAMRDTLTSKSRHWIITSGDDVFSDTVCAVNTPYLDDTILPREGAKYVIATPKIECYLNDLKNRLLTSCPYVTIGYHPVLTNNLLETYNIFGTVQSLDVYMSYFDWETKYEQITKSSKNITLIYESPNHFEFQKSFVNASERQFGFHLEDLEYALVA